MEVRVGVLPSTIAVFIHYAFTLTLIPTLSQIEVKAPLSLSVVSEKFGIKLFLRGEVQFFELFNWPILYFI